MSAACLTCAEVAGGSAAANRAATAATCGVAIDVPVIVQYDDVDSKHVDRIEVPGAKTSTLLAPKFEKNAGLSSPVLAPTQMMLASGSAHG